MCAVKMMHWNIDEPIEPMKLKQKLISMNPDICGVTKSANSIGCDEFRDTIIGTGYTITSKDEN